jgi:4-alpha-glucanotransferase
MRILQFGFSDRGAHNYLPHRYVPNTVVYTGTHDNNTTLGWWDHEATKAEKDAVKTYLGTSKKDVVWAMIRAAETSVADTCILPVQNLLELGEAGRMNMPSSTGDNWSWRLPEGALTPEIAEKLAAITEVADRDLPPPTDLPPATPQPEAERT